MELVGEPPESIKRFHGEDCEALRKSRRSRKGASRFAVISQ